VKELKTYTIMLCMPTFDSLEQTKEENKVLT